MIAAYNARHNSYYFGRGKVQFTAPLLPNGRVNSSGYWQRWGNNWDSLPAVPGDPVLAPGRFVGNAHALEITPRVERAGVSAWDNGNGLIVQGVEASVTLYGHGAQNLADAMHAGREQIEPTQRVEYFAAGRASLEAGGMFFTRFLIDTTLPVTVAPNWTVWTEGVEWEREAFGIRLLCGLSGPLGAQLTVYYTPEGGAETLDAMGHTTVELGLVYTGINNADGAVVRMDCYRATPVLGDALRPLSEAAGTVTLKFELKPVLAAPNARIRWYRLHRGQHPQP